MSLGTSEQHVTSGDGRWIRALAVLVAVAPVLLLWSVEVFPSHDGAAHIYLAKVGRALWHGDNDIYGQLFELNPEPVPNLFFYVAAAPLLSVLPPPMVEKLLGSLFLLGWPLACYYALKPISRFPVVGTILLLPLAFSQLFAMGFYNYCFGLLLTMVGLGLWFRAWLGGGVWHYLALSLVGLLTYFTHLFPAANLLLIVGIGTAIAGLAEQRGQWDASRFGRFIVCRALPFFVALLPTFLLILGFLFQNVGGPGGGFRLQLYSRFLYLIGFSFYLLYARIDVLFSGLIAIAAVRTGCRSIHDGPAETSTPAKYFGILLLVYLIIYMLMPASLLQASFVSSRLFPIMYCVFACCVASRWRDAKFCRSMGVYLAVVIVAATAYRGHQVRQLDQYLSQFYRASEKMQPGRSLLAIPGFLDRERQYGQTWHPDFRVRTMIHISARMAAERDLLDLKLVQSHFSLMPVVYRQERDPFLHLPDLSAEAGPDRESRRRQVGRLEVPPQKLDLRGYETRTGVPIDYILIWGTQEKLWHEGYNSDLRSQIEAGYHPIPLREAPDVLLFERKAEPSSATDGPRIRSG